MTLIISAVVLGIIVFLQPETFPPILLKWKAQHLRELTGDDRYRAEIEIRSETFMQRLGTALYRPFLLTATEPIIILIALYLTVVYIGKPLQTFGYRYSTPTNKIRSTFHLPRRLQLHFCRDSWNVGRNHRTLFPRHHHWPLHLYGSRAIDLLLGKEGDGQDGRARSFQDRARVSVMVLYAWRLHRHSCQPVLDGVDVSPRYFDLEPAGC